MTVLKIFTLVFNGLMALWMICLDCKEKDAAVSVGMKMLILGFVLTMVYIIFN